jgi:hypothetical protein
VPGRRGEIVVAVARRDGRQTARERRRGHPSHTMPYRS